MLNRRYLIELPPPVVWPINDIPDIINVAKAIILISPGPNLTILVGTDASWNSKRFPAKERFYGKTALERRGFPHNIKAGSGSFRFLALSKGVPIWTAFPW